jgi:hypothetical protein
VPDIPFRLRLRRSFIEVPRAYLTEDETVAVLGISTTGLAAHVARLRSVGIGTRRFDADSVAALVRERGNHSELALWAIEQILLDRLRAPEAGERSCSDSSLTWAMNHLLASD